MAIAKLLMRSRISTGAQTTGYRRGYSVTVYSLFPSSPCVPVGRADCTLLNDLSRRSIWLCLGWVGAIAWKLFTRSLCFLCALPWVAVSNCPIGNLLTTWAIFWPLEPSCDLVLYCLSASHRSRGCVESLDALGGQNPSWKRCHVSLYLNRNRTLLY